MGLPYKAVVQLHCWPRLAKDALPPAYTISSDRPQDQRLRIHSFAKLTLPSTERVDQWNKLAQTDPVKSRHAPWSPRKVTSFNLTAFFFDPKKSGLEKYIPSRSPRLAASLTACLLLASQTPTLSRIDRQSPSPIQRPSLKRSTFTRRAAAFSNIAEAAAAKGLRLWQSSTHIIPRISSWIVIPAA